MRIRGARAPASLKPRMLIDQFTVDVRGSGIRGARAPASLKPRAQVRGSSIRGARAPASLKHRMSYRLSTVDVRGAHPGRARPGLIEASSTTS